ncbi:MAG: hypothetical protein WB677_25770 [Xanthobacteraceae bacterium]
MIDGAYVVRMARYNRWQNEDLYGAADRLSDTDRRRERGATHHCDQVHCMLTQASARPCDTDLPFMPE